LATETVPSEKTLPHNGEAERTVLGAVLVDNAAFNSAAEVLVREDFYREAHRRIYDAMAALAERSQPIDLVTLKDELTRASALEAVGGAAYLASLLDGLPRMSNARRSLQRRCDASVAGFRGLWWTTFDADKVYARGRMIRPFDLR
jgi:replicative DNA helicase